MSADVDQLIRWGDNLQKAPGRIGREVAAEVVGTATTVAELGADYAPEGETGDLSTEITVTKEGSGRSGDIFVRVTFTAPYAHFVHYGTSRQRPQPFADRALAAQREQHIERLRTIVEGVLRSA